ncbi:hypothetical protein EMCRGX_G017084 [Ephydatia muelleri]
MLQQWEATLQHQQHEFSIQQQQHDIAMQRRWEQLQREYAVQQQPNYNPYGPQLPYWSPPVGHSSGPDLYQSAPQQPRPVFEPKKHQRPLDSSGEVLPLRAPDLSAGKNPSTCSYQSHPAANIVDGKNLKHGSQAWLDNELAIALRQEEEDQQKAYQDQLRKDEELAMKLQAEWGSENAKNLQGQQEKQDPPQLQGQEH